MEKDARPFFIRADEYALQERGKLRFQWQAKAVDWHGTPYANIYAALHAERKEKNLPDHIPFDILPGLLCLSEMQLVDLLNAPHESKRHLISNLEEAFREHERKASPDGKPFFTRADIFGFPDDPVWDQKSGDVVKQHGLESEYSVDVLDLEQWATDNPDMLPENRYRPAPDDPEALRSRIGEMTAEIATLRAQLADREQTIKELEKTAQAAAQGADHLRPFWRYVQTCEQAGKTDPEIAMELKRDGFSWPSIGMLLHKGELTMAAVEKAYQRMKREIPDIFPK